ncbi:hypothetical protein [Aquabacterium sp.]|uniref:hypothetical protein n=1 Tax=Aquabacterium sp. TaxID=1872578 RepID=UPI002D19AD6A|nr:hypothetical protein [Aquabacterium sp.]HSW08132.1 hypothetical protein [Aquabacterium sp.]
MSLLKQALRAGLSPVRLADGAATQQLVIAGAAGPLGAAVLEQALGQGQWGAVSALVTQPLEVALRGLVAVQVGAELSPAAAFAKPPDTAIVVFDRERSFHGREAAFLRPQPDRLAALARWLQAQGVQRLVLVMPHAPSLLPQALKAGLASLDEQAVAALGFAQFVIVRPTRLGAGAEAEGLTTNWPHAMLSRLAAGLLAQLRWMVPQRDQPLRASKVAQFVIALAQALPQWPTGTRVAPPELLWDWAQPGGGEPVLQAWLRDGRWSAAVQPAQRW